MASARSFCPPTCSCIPAKTICGREHHPLPRDQRHRFRLRGEGVREDLELEGFLGDLLHVDGPEAHRLADQAEQRGAVRGFHRDDSVAETAAGGSDLGAVGLVVLGVEVEGAVHSRLQGLAELRRLEGDVEGNRVDGVSVQLQPAGLLKALDQVLVLSRGDQFLGPGHLLKLFFVFHWGPLGTTSRVWKPFQRLFAPRS